MEVVPSPVDPLVELEKDVDNLKSLMANLYIPKHFDSLMRKVGSIESHMVRAQNSMTTCYNVTFFVVFLFTLLLLGVVYIIWRMGYFKFFTRHNVFRRYARPKSCYACYRPWKKSGARKEAVIKGSFSSPELMQDQVAPSPNLVCEADLTSSSSSSEQ